MKKWQRKQWIDCVDPRAEWDEVTVADFATYMGNEDFHVEELWGDPSGYHIELWCRRRDDKEFLWIMSVSTTCYWYEFLIDSWEDLIDCLVYLAPTVTAAISSYQHEKFRDDELQAYRQKYGIKVR